LQLAFYFWHFGACVKRRHVRLISFLGLVCAALFFFSTC